MREVAFRAKATIQAPFMSRIDDVLAAGDVPSSLLTSVVTPRGYRIDRRRTKHIQRYSSRKELLQLVEAALEAHAAQEDVTDSAKQLPPYKIAMLLPTYFGPSFVEQDLTFGFKSSAQLAGLSSAHWATDGVAYGNHVDATPTREEILKSVIDFAPHLVLGEGNFLGNKSGLGVDFYDRVTQESGARVGIVLPDNWGGAFQQFWQYWGQAANALLYFQRNSPVVGMNLDAKTLLMPLPVAPLEGAERVPKSTDVAFSGSLYGNRPHILRNVALFCSKEDLHFRYRSRLALSQSDFVAASRITLDLADARVVVNPTWRARGTFCVNGRSFQVPAAGSLLIQEEPPNEYLLADHFVPFLEYLPFSGMRELLLALDFTFEFPELANGIALRGLRASRFRHGPVAVWRKLLGDVGLQR